MHTYQPLPSDVVTMQHQITRCVRQYLREGNHLNASPEHTMNLIFNAVASPESFVRFLMDGDTPHGYFIGAKAPELFTGIPTSVMIGMWADKEHATGVHMMMREFEAWSKEQGCKKMYIHLTPPTDFERWERVLTRKGYSPAERNFSKEL